MSNRAPQTIADLPFRAGVGIMLLNGEGRTWIGRRRPKWLTAEVMTQTAGFNPELTADGVWQMPQGGMDPHETPEQAAFRELKEETGIHSATIIGQVPGWLSYQLPDELLGVALKGRYRGQRQRWFAMRFTGDDSEVDISGHNGTKAEFDSWQWAGATTLANLIVPFKRDMYSTIIDQFAHLTT
jgi:putative (di)nucleoside polyphosphate hydrolase